MPKLGSYRMLRAFIRWNCTISAWLARWLPQTRPHAEDIYIDEVAGLIDERPGLVVLDVGGGKSCGFVGHYARDSAPRLVAVDVSPDELRQNRDVDLALVADVCGGLALADESVDVIVSRSALEHLPEQRAFLAEAARVLRKRGQCIHFFPCKFAPFAMINQLLPHSVSRRIVHGLLEGSEGTLGFRAYYRGTYYSGFRRMLSESGYRVLRTHCTYYQSFYFRVFVPLFVLSAAYEMVIAALGVKDLCAYVIVVAVKE
jgi:ubiquinone/menaquinone biosynthesis C-methylase UbiE